MRLPQVRHHIPAQAELCLMSPQALPSVAPSQLLGKPLHFPSRIKQKLSCISVTPHPPHFYPGIKSVHSLAAPLKAPIFLELEWNSLPFSGCELAQMLLCILKKSQAAHTGHPADTGRSPCSRQGITRVCSSKFKLFLQVELLITALECFLTVPIHCLCSATRCWNSTGEFMERNRNGAFQLTGKFTSMRECRRTQWRH